MAMEIKSPPVLRGKAVAFEWKVKQLPIKAHKEVSDYLDFLLYKYSVENERKVTFTDFGLVMPADYSFNREEANAR